MALPAPKLTAYQACFIVEDVPRALQFCEEMLGWGPFQHFRIPLEHAEYRGWSGPKLNEVALGMAGSSQVELMHVHQGQDSMQQYQRDMGTGLQHIGVLCHSTTDAVAHLSALGAEVDDSRQYGDITFSFINSSLGPALLELLERGERGLPTQESMARDMEELTAQRTLNTRLAPDRVTLAVADIAEASRFLGETFSAHREIIDDCLRIRGSNGAIEELLCKRCIVPGGVLEFELVQPMRPGNDPYSRHLRRASAHGNHALVHIGGHTTDLALPGPTISGEWRERAEHFLLCSGPDERCSLQLRLG